MKKLKIPTWLNTRLGFFLLLTILMWCKSIFAYLADFNLGVEGAFQQFILLINPFATVLLLLGVALYVRGKKTSYITMLVIYFILTMLLFSNVAYYREFSDFLTVNTILGSGKVASGLGESAMNLFRPYDLLYWLDLPILITLLAMKKIKMQEKPFRGRMAIATTALAIMIFSGNLFLAETDRPELLSRTFSKDYLVKYLGINAYTMLDGVQTYKTSQVRAKASPTDLNEVESYVKSHYAQPNTETFGLAKGKNVIYIHLESFQQFLIDYKLKDEQGKEHVVTPFINSLFHSNSTFAFDNFFHQVSSGKTSDAETLMENSFFGLADGPLFTQLGGKNTFEAAPSILQQTQGYTSAVFHGNAGTFWNRNETYKRLGYNYFFDASYFDVTADNSFQYGLHDKPFFEQSVQYLEHLQQPFYTKFIAVSNHYPYEQFKNGEAGFPIANTKDDTINGYFATANYLDKAVEEFFNYLKKSGLYDNSIIVLYGDHYGVSNTRNPDLAELLGKDKTTWNDYNNAMMQRVPYMIHVPNSTKGGINHTFGGQVDALPTLLHLLGIKTENYIQLGQDLLSKQHQGIVAFRNGQLVTSQYTILGEKIYNTTTGEEITNPTPEITEIIKKDKEAARQQLATSDKLTNGDLLRFYTESGLKPVDPDQFVYKKELAQLENIEEEKGEKSTSLYSKNKDKSTVELYSTKTYEEYNGVANTTSSEPK
ncbi:lipoteichoic acid synthase [Pilibacter termitis]|uniref:Lipoteichoic acid synthase n=1 Tax=Pilibacter termitis TaxID=263852 RepID=A0A1T4K392_9ENTE|nr:LTA synthase family protein [Pilibacter termitis]SJZ36813.1 lipoteichoic acid synthase [Pilibacter termitis]